MAQQEKDRKKHVFNNAVKLTPKAARVNGTEVALGHVSFRDVAGVSGIFYHAASFQNVSRRVSCASTI
jgi:hypothetical protein